MATQEAIVEGCPMTRSVGEVTGAYPEPTTLGRILNIFAVALMCIAGLAFPIVMMVGEVWNALDGDFRSFGLGSVVGVFWLVVVGRLLWRWFVWDPPRRVARFRYADGVLEYQTKRQGLQRLELGQVANVFARYGRGGRVFDWLIRCGDGEWLIVAAATENAQELIDGLCRDAGKGRPAQSPV